MVTIAWEEGGVRFLDQTRLPHEERYVVTSDYRVVGKAIRELQIRGAPAIGVAAGFAAALAVRSPEIATLDEARTALSAALAYLEQTRPTAVNLFRALDRIRAAALAQSLNGVGDLRDAVLREAQAIMEEDIQACVRLGLHGASLILPGSALLTHCNTGALATAGQGTALGVITTAHRQGKVRRVYVDETRPLLQGARLTVWELLRLGIETTLITDSTAATVLQRHMVQAVLVGADRIAANGDIANKVGTYPVAVLAARHEIPFYVVAPTSTIDLRTPTGESIPIEERDSAEVTHIGGVRVAAEGVRVFSPAFDITPNEFISAIVTENGILRPPFGPGLAGAGGKGSSDR
jgi:methylthioribose-1-phosphate isomerase